MKIHFFTYQMIVLIIGLMMLGAKSSSAQILDTLTKGTIKTRSADEPVYDFTPTMGVRFANLSFMAKNIDASADMYTGVVNSEIPIYEIQTSGGKIPISLTYRSTGIRVEEIASEVGLGWELSAGGQIIRSKRGQVDKKEDLIYADMHAEADGQDYYDHCVEGEWDTQPDLYYFNFPGGGGSFAFDLEWKPRTIPYQNVSIDYKDEIFTILDAKGTKYVFSTTESKKDRGKKYISSWFLDRIEYINGTTIIYKYETGGDYVEWDWNSIANIFVMFPLQPNYLITNPTSEYSYKNYVLSPKYLKSISYKGQEVKFIYDTLRTDIAGLKRLIRIDVQENNEKYRSYKLNYGTFPDETPKLLSVKEQPQIGITRPLCSFEYYEDVYLPKRGKGYKGFDHWGFFNTNIEEPLSYPELSLVIPNLKENDSKGASRKPILQFTRSQSLKKIIYPNGGTKELVYELHRGFNSKTKRNEDAGGLRIKEIIERTSDSSTPHVTRYNYIAGTIYDDAFNYIAEYGELDYNKYRIKVSSKSVGMPVDFYGSSVVYSAVEEYLPNGSHIRYEYVPLSMYADLEPEFIFLKYEPARCVDIKGHSAKTSRAWGRNILTSKEWFSDKQSVRRETYKYLIDTAHAIKIPSRFLYADGHYYDQYSIYPNYSKCYYDKSYLISCPVVPIENNVAKRVGTLPTRTSILYDEHYAPTIVVNTDCQQNRMTTFLQYPDSASSNLCMDKLVKRNVQVPIEKVTYKNGKVVDAEINCYKLNQLNPDYIVPDKKIQLRYRQLIDSTELKLSKWGKENLEYDQTKYRTAVIYDEYDDEGNLLCYHEPDGIYHSIIYDITQSIPIAFVENARHSVRTNGRVNQVFFNDFESGGIDNTKAKSGYRVGNNLMSYAIDLTHFVAGSYVFSYWYKTSDTARWKRHQEDVTVGFQSSTYYITLVPEALYIDDMSLLPKNAVLASECTIPSLGKISETDAQGRTTYYEYNKVGLPSRVYDNNRTLIQQYSYDNYGVDL